MNTCQHCGKAFYLTHLCTKADREGADWIEWKSGKCPVPKGTLVDVKGPGDAVFRNVLAWHVRWCNVDAYRLAADQPAKCVPPAAPVDPMAGIGPGRIWFKHEATPGTDGVSTDFLKPREVIDPKPIKGTPQTVISMQVAGYDSLADVLLRAFQQAATGKGAERHAQGEPFDQQVMQDMARRFGVGALLGQAFKKSEESQRLPRDRAVAELLGAINYLAGAVISLERQPEN